MGSVIASLSLTAQSASIIQDVVGYIRRLGTGQLLL